MANTVIAIRSSGTAAATPSLGVIANGEISLNYADGIIYYKTASNTLGSIRTTQPAGLTTELQFNDAGSFGSNSGLTFSKTTGYFKAPIIESTNNGNGTNFKVGDDSWIGDINIANALRVKGQQDSTKGYIVFGDSDGAKLGRAGTGALTYEGNFVANGELSTLNSVGDEGGQINFGIPQTNTTLNAGVVVDVYQNKLRFYESGGTNRGAYIDLTAASASVATNLLSGGGGTVTSVAGATGAVSNNQILAGLLTVDGAGSGLDADLLDGLSSASFANAAFANTDYTTISATAGVYGNASYIPVTTLTANGRVSSITNTAIAIDADSITSGTLAVARGGTGVTTSTGTGAVVLNTSPTLSTPTVDRVDWPAVGYAPPSLTTRSSGTKLTLYPSLSSSSVDYAIGIDGGVLWSSIPAANTNYTFKWYGGESQIASLSGTGLFTTITANITSTTTSTSKTTGALIVSGGVGVSGDLFAGNSIVVDNQTYGNVTITQFGSVWGQGYGGNPYSIMQVRSNDFVSGMGMQVYAGLNGLLYSNTGIQFKTSVITRDKDYPTGGTNAGQFAANGAFIAQASLASTSNATGSIQVVGGIGVKGNVSADGIIFPDNTRQTTAATGGASIGDVLALAIALG